MAYDREKIHAERDERLAASPDRALLLHLKDALAFLDAHSGRTMNGILDCEGYRFYYDDALALVNKIERGRA